MVPDLVRKLRLTVVLLSSCALLAGPLGAQDGAGEARTGGWTPHLGLVVYGTGEEVNCPYGTGLVGGVEGRTGGARYLVLAGDLYFAAPAACTLVGWEYDGGVELLFAPRLSVRAGTSHLLGGYRLEPSAGVGAINSSSIWGNQEMQLNPWFGGVLVVRRLGGRRAIGAEYGWHRVVLTRASFGLTEGRVPQQPPQVHHWKPLVNLGIGG
jgi:hypothetical protein